MKSALFVAAMYCGAVASAASIDVQQLVKQSVSNTERNWNEAPNYTFLEHDIVEKLDAHGGVKSKTDKTFEVMMLDGSQYNKLVAINGKPLSPEQQKAEEEKLEAERHRREQQSRAERAKRVAKYEKERKQDHAMIHEMAEAFDFKLVGEENVDGRHAYVLEASPKPGYVPKSRDAKVLTAMKGKLWIDKSELQWVKVEAEVMHPVSFYAVATVSPGTKFILEQEPVAKGLWMPKHFAVNVNANVFWMSRNSSQDEHYANYRRVSGEAARANTKTTGHEHQ
jgi:hypothetical protein